MGSSIRGERGNALVITMVVTVVLGLMLAGMLQVSSMSHRVGRFEVQRQQALAAAESGLNVAVARLAAGRALVRSSYPDDDPGIDTETDDWLGPGTGCRPPEVSLGDGVSFQVWVSEPTGGVTTLVAVGRSGGRTRTLRTQVSSGMSDVSFDNAITSTRASADRKNPALNITGSAKIFGGVRLEASNHDAINMVGSSRIEGILTMGPGTDVGAVLEDLGSRVDGVEASSSVRTYPGPIPPSGLPLRGAFSHTGSKDARIGSSGEYTSFRHTGSGNLTFDATLGDITIYIRGDFDFTGSGEIRVIGDHRVRVYVDGEVKGTGSGVIGASGDPRDFIIYCLGDRVCITGSTPGNNTPPSAFAVYAPNAVVDITGSRDILGGIIGDRVNITGSGSITWFEGLSDLDLGETEGAPGFVVGSWLELH
ncbi:MAG: pilus assembly PilX N-terminal domain-containing protein [Firmicutes bacterium]|jgi:type II secretory pathway pseudopilin PulG|nr:pilus assembly PilX N-terminal domain-containing protein [Bacillota bacterium]